MRLTPADYRHPAEQPALVAGLWLAVTLLLAVHGLALILIVTPPLGAWPLRIIGALVIVLLDLGLGLGLVRLSGHLAEVRSAARPVGPVHYPRVHRAAQLAAERLHLPATPPVLVLSDLDLRSFTLAWRRSEIVVTEGLIEKLGDLELRAALAHEMGRIRGGRSRLVALIAEPLRARLVHPVLLGCFALAWLGLRPWDRAAQLSADRAAAIAVGGAEPVAGWLNLTLEHSTEALDPELRHYLTFGADHFDRVYAEAELRQSHPTIARRVIELARFVRSRRFANCLAIIGDLQLEVQPTPDPASAGVLPFVTIGVLAGLWLAPVTVALTLALGAPEPASATALTATEPPPTTAFDPNAPETIAPSSAPEAPAPAAPTPGSAEDLAGLLEVARIHKNHGDLANARRTLESILLRDPTMVEAHYMLAWVHAQAGDRDLAADEFRAVVNLADPESEQYRQAAEALKRLGY